MRQNRKPPVPTHVPGAIRGEETSTEENRARARRNEPLPLLSGLNGNQFKKRKTDSPGDAKHSASVNLTIEMRDKITSEAQRDFGVLRRFARPSPNAAWLYLNREVFERLYAYKRQHGLATWEQVMEHLLPAPKREEVLV